MRRILIISDVHSNLPALQSVLEDSEKHGQYTEKYCLGDVVGYGPWPNECIAEIGRLGFKTTRGNHDRAVLTGNTYGFNGEAVLSAQLNSQMLSGESYNFLDELDPKPSFSPQVGFVHASFNRCLGGIFEDGYIEDHPLDSVGAMVYLNYKDGHSLIQVPVGVVGHTHIPRHSRGEFFQSGKGTYVFKEPVVKRFYTSDYVDGVVVVELDLSIKRKVQRRRVMPKHIINFGSVGQPRHGSPNACYGILTIDNEKAIAEFRHVPYDVRRTQRELNRKAFPPELSDRLAVGR